MGSEKIRKNIVKSKRSQVTIFIILALIIVVAIALIFVLFRKPTISLSPEDNPQAYIEKCVKDAAEEALDILMPQGSYIEPTNYVLYENNKIGYLCYNTNFYQQCINQEPMLIKHIEQEIIDYIEPKITGCFNSLRGELREKDYEVTMKSMKINAELQPKKVIINIDRVFELVKNKETRSFTKFKTQVLSPVYELSEIALEIVNQEAKFCYFEYLGYMIFYPKYNIEKFVTGDDAKIYTLTEIITNKKFKFAIKSCVLPPGL